MGTVLGMIKRTGPLKRLLYRVVPFRHRYGQAYGRTLDLIEKLQYDEGLLDQYVEVQQSMLLVRAQATPYYGERVAQLTGGGLASDPAILEQLDVTDKDQIRRAGAGAFRSFLYEGKTVTLRTSGSTGEPLELYANPELRHMEAAFITRAYRAHGVDLYTEPVVWLRGYAPKEDEPRFIYDPELRRLRMSVFHLGADTVKAYVESINRSRARCISGYPSSLYALAALMADQGLSLDHEVVCHAASEQMLPAYRDAIAARLGPVYEHYGQRECVSLFFQCRYGTWHEAVDYGMTRLLPGVGGAHIIASGYHNMAMTLVNYDTGDLAMLKPAARCKCGRVLPAYTGAFAGRSDDILQLGDRLVPPVNFYTMMYRVPGVRAWRIVQTGPMSVAAQLVVVPDADPDEVAAEVRDALYDRLFGARIAVEVVDSLPRAASGKLKCVERQLA